MRIAIYHNLPSGGAKRTLFETLRRLVQRHEVDVYTLITADEQFCDLRPLANRHQAYQFTPLRLFHSPLGRLNQLQRWRDLRHLDQLARQIAGEMDAEQYDVVLAQPCMWSQAPLVLRHLRTASVYYCHEPPRALYERHGHAALGATRRAAILNRVDPLIPLYRSTARRLDREASRASRVMLVNSRYMQETVKRIYGRDSQVSYHGVDTRLFYPRSNVRRGEDVLSVGAIQPHKGFGFLIESLSVVSEALRPRLRLIGNEQHPEERAQLEKLAAQVGVDLVIETKVTEEILIQRYNEAALVAYTPHNEPFGLVPLEAMACGTPVVAVAEGGVRESVVHGVTGLLTERDCHQFAGAVGHLLSDPDLRHLYGRQAREHVLRHWSWDAAVERVETHLRNATSGAVGDSVLQRLSVYGQQESFAAGPGGAFKLDR
jgi:glycosyltransferase involved in cell wall biosynthesis